MLKGTDHDKQSVEPVSVSMVEQVEAESQAVSLSMETVVPSPPTMPDMCKRPQGLVLCAPDTATTPTLTIRGPHVLIPSPEPEGSLVKEMASLMGRISSRHDSFNLGKKVTPLEAEAQPGALMEEEGSPEVIEVDRQSEGSQHSEISLNPRAALERSAQQRGIQNRRSYQMRRLYQAVLQLHRLSDREIRRWTRDRGRAVADPESASPVGPIQVQRVRRPVRHPTETASPRARCGPSVRKGSEMGN